jgi:hypothetical protein
LNLSELKKHMVDLRRSEFDKDRSSPKDGRYIWTKKVYLLTKDYRDDQTRPNFKYRWVAFDKNDDFASFNHWRMNFDASPVDYKDAATEVYPEPLVPDAEGHYRFMDMILMKIPVAAEVDRIMSNRKQFDKAAEGLQKKFNTDAGAEQAAFTEGNVYEVTKG